MDKGTAEDFIEDLRIELWRLQAENHKLRAQNDALRDIVRAAQYLSDIVHIQHNDSLGGTFGAALANLRAALRNWYEPNGTGR